MFTSPIDLGRTRWKTALILSFALHCLILGLLVRRSAAIFVVPSDTDLGIRGSSGSVSITYLAPVGPEKQRSIAENLESPLKAAKLPTPKLKAEKAVASHSEPSTDTATTELTARGGSPYGRVPGAPLTGNEIIPALPEVFPDPSVSRADLPAGLEGDVIVEVTIDSEGNVVETKLLHGLGYGIEQKVLAAVQHWHFRPATKNGVTIASQHVVYFHYPS